MPGRRVLQVAMILKALASATLSLPTTEGSRRSVFSP
jgi:hypothetical protein